MGFHDITIRVINCYKPMHQVISTRPSSCDTLYYSLDTLTPEPYFYFGQCSHFFDQQSWTTRSCINTTAKGSDAPVFYEAINYYLIKLDPTDPTDPTKRTHFKDADIAKLAEEQELWDLSSLVASTDILPYETI